LATNNKKQITPAKTNIENQLPEWAKGHPEAEFLIDFAHPDAPALAPNRTVTDNKKVAIEDIQMYDVVYGNNVIGIVDRRASGRNKFKGIDLEKAVTENTQEQPQDSKSPDKSTTEEIQIGNLVIMIRGKVIGYGNLDDVSEVILTLISKDNTLSDDDIVLFERRPLTIILDKVNSKY
jgi:hypothetical protein